MICTFGDTTDVTWWRELRLETRAIMDRDGKLIPLKWGTPGWESENQEQAQRYYDEITGLRVKQAQKRIVELLRDADELLNEPEPISHAVKFYEKGDRPLEIVTSRQWYIKNGGIDTDIRKQLIERGQQLSWHPANMRSRYEDWVNGLNSDWLISRQRFFGVPIPLWYPLDSGGSPDYENPIIPNDEELPLDPYKDVPHGYSDEQRGKSDGFTGDPDVMDTWVTSSISPQVVAKFGEDDDFMERIFPMDLRPQAHDIIRTWLFYTVVRSHLEHGSLPWWNTAISGWVLDPDRKKMSKSKGNVVVPTAPIEQYGSDAVRYWACSGRLARDTAFDENQMKVGRRLAIKLLNACKFALSGVGEDTDSLEITEPLDKAMLLKLANLVDDVTESFEKFDYARALEVTERFFWSYTDNYIELVKGRAYGNRGDTERDSARKALGISVETFLKLFAPHMPFVTEEIWSWWREGSVHRATWPLSDDIRKQASTEVDETAFDIASEVLSEIRKAKTEANVSLGTPIKEVVVSDTGLRLEVLSTTALDVRDAGKTEELRMAEAAKFAVSVILNEGD
jgi:valyl-tRNA synthetase